MRKSLGAVLMCICTATACGAQTDLSEDKSMTKHSTSSPGDPKPAVPFPSVQPKRPAPPKVAPVTFEGIRYEQASSSDIKNGDQRTGYLAAYKADTNERLWVVKVYDLKTIPHLERDVQEIYFKKMEVSPKTREIIVENEGGGRYAVNVDTRAVRAMK